MEKKKLGITLLAFALMIMPIGTSVSAISVDLALIGNKLNGIGDWDGVTPSRELPGKYVDTTQQEVGFGARSYWVAPWRSYMDTWDASKYINGAGVVINGTRDYEADAVMKILSESGIKTIRMEMGWGNFNYDDETTFPEYKLNEYNNYFAAMKKYGIRPIILLNSNSGIPTPIKRITVNVTQSVAKGAREVYISPSDVSKIVIGYTGFDGLPGAVAGAYPLIKSADAATGKLTLSAPLPDDVAIGITNMVTLKYRPLGADRQLDGTPDADTIKTLEGWKTYVKSATNFAKARLGTPNDAGFDLEVWNELMFGSEFLDLNNYYDPKIQYPNPRMSYTKYGKSVTGFEVLLPITIDYAKVNLPKTRVVNGFANQRPWENGTEMMPDEYGFSRHYYTSYANSSYIIKGNPDLGESNIHLNALGKKDGGDGLFANAFIPNHVSAMPERWFYAYQTEYMTRDLQPFAGPFSTHGRFSSPGEGVTAKVWETETNTWRMLFLDEVMQKKNVTWADPRVATLSHSIGAKGTLREFVFYPHKGIEAFTMFTVRDEHGFGVFTEDFFNALAANNYVLTDEIKAKAGPQLDALRNTYNLIKTGVKIDNPRPLDVSKVVEYKPRLVFKGDGTPEHPNRYNSEDLAILPYQLANNKFAIGYYVVTRDISHSYDTSKDLLDPARYQMPDQDYDITLKNIYGTGAVVSTYDPLLNQTIPAQIVDSTENTITVRMKTVDYPRFLVVEELKEGPQILNPLLEKTTNGGLFSFTPNKNGTAEITWGPYPIRKASTFTQTRFSDEQFKNPVETKQIDFINAKNGFSGRGSWEWATTFVPKYTEKYTFSYETDNSIQIYVNDQAILSDNTWNTGSIDLEAGKEYQLRIRYTTPYDRPHTLDLYTLSLSEPRNYVMGKPISENKIIKNVTANQTEYVPISGLKLGDGVSVRLVSDGLINSYPRWDYDVQSVIYNSTPLRTQAIPTDANPAPITDTTPPAEVLNLGETHDTSSAVLTFSQPNDARFHHANVYCDGALVGSTLTSSYRDIGLSTGKAYTYKIKTVGTTGNESAGITIVVRMDATLTPTTTPTPVVNPSNGGGFVPIVPSPTDTQFPTATPTPIDSSAPKVALTAVTLEGTTQIKWNPVQGATGYNVYVDSKKLNTSPIKKSVFETATVTYGEHTLAIKANVSENEKLVKETNVTVQEAKKFADIVPTHWAKYDISWIVQRGYASGMDSNTFAPDKELSRAEAAKLVSTITGVTNDGQNGNGFSDVPSYHWASKEIATMKRLGYMEGVEDGTFNPSGVVTREQLAQLLTNILKLKAKDASNAGFSDVLASDWSSSAIQLVKSNGIMEGFGDGTFHPKEPLTRSQMATVIRNTADFWK